MTRQSYLFTFVLALFAEATLLGHAQAQTLTVGRGGVQYHEYGGGHYGGYGQGYNGYAPGNRGFSTYGNGPYGYGTRNGNQFPNNRGYGNGAHYNGYGNSGSYRQSYGPVYRPYGFGIYSY